MAQAAWAVQFENLFDYKTESPLEIRLHANVAINHAMLNSQMSLLNISLLHGTLLVISLFLVNLELTICSVSFSVIMLENLYGRILLKIGQELPSGASSPNTKKTQKGITFKRILAIESYSIKA